MEEETTDPAFELSGGDLCLDFANTWGDRGRPETDKLLRYADLLTFARQAGVLSAGETEHFGAWAVREPGEAGAVFRSGRGLREDLYCLFSAIAAGRPPARSHLARLNAALPLALSHLRLERQAGGFVWSWEMGDPTLESPLWPVLRSAAELLTSGDLRQLRECAGSGCTWLFLDHSRNRSRRWCSMETCGNRAKARRHYQRQQGQHHDHGRRSSPADRG